MSIADILDPATLTPAADRALSTGRPVVAGGLTLVPDVLVAELAANGHPVPVAPVLERGDGRRLYAFRAPEGVAS